MSGILVVGSVAYDSISTPEGEAPNTLGGSANYFSICASYFSSVNVIGVVGEDYKEQDFKKLSERSVNIKGLQQVPGKTFSWKGRYNEDLNEAITLDTQLNVFKNFDPQLPESYKNLQYIFLANIDPKLQMKVLDQVYSPKVVGIDTMGFWIESKNKDLKNILSRVDVLFLNEGEARKLAEVTDILKAAHRLAEMGPRFVVIKRGEYGFLAFNKEASSDSKKFFILPAFPVQKVVDPTGAGDTFAGGFFGYLSAMNLDLSWDFVKRACVNGCLMSSFTVEGFGLSHLEDLTAKKLIKRYSEYKEIVGCDIGNFDMNSLWGNRPSSSTLQAEFLNV